MLVNRRKAKGEIDFRRCIKWTLMNDKCNKWALAGIVLITLCFRFSSAISLKNEDIKRSSEIIVPRSIIDKIHKACPITVLREKDDEVCLTKDCVLTASTLIQAMDTTVDPCEDFYKFSCANFMRKHLVPEDQYSFKSWSLFNQDLELQMKDLLENLNPHGQPKVVARMQEAYHVCINTTYQPEKEFQAFINFTKEVFQWPLAFGEDWSSNSKNITDFLNSISNSYSNGLFDIKVDFHEDDPSIIRISSIIPVTFLHKNDSIGESPSEDADPQLEAELELLNQLVKLFGNNDSNSIEQDINDMKDISKYCLERKADLRGDPAKNVTIEELTAMTDNKIDWLKILNAKVQKTGYTFSKTDNVTLENFSQISLLGEIIDKFSWRALNNALAWRPITFMLRFAGPLSEKLYADIKSKVGKTRSPDMPQERWKVCVNQLHMAYSLVITRVFINKYVNKESKSSVDELIQLIQQAYRKAISESSWVDEETKMSALQKADSIRRFVGYPDFIFNDEELDEEFSDMPEIRSTHFLNQIHHFYYWEMINNNTKKDRDPIKYDRWFVNPLEINAFYAPMANSIWFPIGIMQLPFFDDSRLAAVNFGMIGSIIGHEVGHAFDNRGSLRDHTGAEVNWWSNETRSTFEDKAQCFTDQFATFCPEELKGDENETFCVHGSRTLGENLADYTGMQASFSAYKLWIKRHGAEKRLPGMQEFTPEQIFFLSYAYPFCEIIPPDKWHDRYHYDSHSPGQYRVLGPLSNSKDFRETFNCPEGPMNRGNDSCTMW